MATGMVLTVVQTLLSALENKELRELCSMFGYESQLADLQGTVETINAVLLDAESKHQELSNQGKDWLAKLKDAVYDADDLFDDFKAMSEQQRFLPGGKISKKVRRFFSSDNQLLFAANTSRKIKKLREKLDKIAKDRIQFGFSDVYIPVKRREETLSYVHESSIIGRDADREAVLGLMLGDVGCSSIDVRDNVCFVSIVGIGGLGKTALAQLVYNDYRIKSTFEVSFWVCVSEEFSMEEILSKMLGRNELRKETLLREVRRQIEGKRYFLVLDDVWNESRNEWEKLQGFLLLGARGSRILVTSRSLKVARAIGDYPLYQLQGLSDENSWLLFERIAFNQKSRRHVGDDLIDIGKDIVKKCANVPLSIRVIGSMLYDQDKSKWVLFQKLDLAKMGEGDEGIMPILKFSYYHLTPNLKSCFSYCALFPKDYVIKKRFLINIWAAQGCLKPLNENQNMEDMGEENFSILSQRCFLQDIEFNDFGETYRCKMHDLIHDLALQVAGKELYLMLETSTSLIDGNTRYLSIAYWRSSLLANSMIPKMRGLRTFFRPSSRAVDCESQVVTMLENCRRLRVLDLHRTSIKVLPSTMNKLSHLRYLDLSDNRLAVLPESISRLHHLQELILRDLTDLKKLPKNLGKLVNLRHLELDGCNNLTEMPSGMNNLTNLRTLTTYVLGEGSSRQAHIGQLKDLEPLKNLNAFVKIIFNHGYYFDASSASEVAYLLDKKNIQILHIHERGIWAHENERHDIQPVIIDEILLERLEPHQGLIKLNLVGYIGSKMPKWGITIGMSFPLLVDVSMSHFPNLLRVPPLYLLQHLHTLSLRDMPKVEYMEEGDSGSAIVPSFRSLEFLTLDDLPSMKSFPECLHVKKVLFSGLSKALTFCRRSNDFNRLDGNHVIHLESLKIDNLNLLDSLFGKYLRSIHSLTLLNNSEVKTLSSSTVVNVYQRHASSILYLRFQGCPNLKSLSGGGLEHLINLQKLTIWKCHSLNFEDENAIPWRALHTLPHLCLAFLPQLVHLPQGLQYLTSLQALELSWCHNLFEDLPDWLQCFISLRTIYLDTCPTLKSLPESVLGSLTRLHIINCPLLTERYREPIGKDWPKICHIPDTFIFSS